MDKATVDKVMERVTEEVRVFGQFSAMSPNGNNDNELQFHQQAATKALGVVRERLERSHYHMPSEHRLEVIAAMANAGAIAGIMTQTENKSATDAEIQRSVNLGMDEAREKYEADPQKYVRQSKMCRVSRAIPTTREALMSR